jgi:hypothetical protein
MSDKVFDAGALIALERNSRVVWAAVKAAALSQERVFVPSTVLAQVWRGSARQARLGSALRLCTIASFDPMAREAGELCGRTGTSDICDAHVALVASSIGGSLYTSDPGDLNLLLAALPGKVPVLVRC